MRKDSYTNSVFIIDEPELHINTAIQRKLLIEINKLIGENCQIWIATHSIGFLRALQDDFKDDSQIIEFQTGKNWGKEEYTLTPMILNRNNWQRLFSTALDDLAELICPKTIVYCEGKDKPDKNGREQGFDAKVYNTIFSKKYPDVLFVSSGGNTELDQRREVGYQIMEKVFGGRIEILVLKDLDMVSGKKATEHDRDTYLRNNPPFHRVLKRFEIENYLYDKEVLKKYCELNSLIFDEVAYDNFLSENHDKNLKESTMHMKSFCNIKTQINPETFKLNLSEMITEGMKVYTELEEVIFEKRN